ncbi:MAG TPA: hypothetical protein VKK79_14280 [Candidatus Lokiarchaeia archaeon]|nr:hypothetical protein [Candidatus Lokiarchaeia archaeon]
MKISPVTVWELACEEIPSRHQRHQRFPHSLSARIGRYMHFILNNSIRTCFAEYRKEDAALLKAYREIHDQKTAQVAKRDLRIDVLIPNENYFLRNPLTQQNVSEKSLGEE